MFRGPAPAAWFRAMGRTACRRLVAAAQGLERKSAWQRMARKRMCPRRLGLGGSMGRGRGIAAPFGFGDLGAYGGGECRGSTTVSRLINADVGVRFHQLGASSPWGSELKTKAPRSGA